MNGILLAISWLTVSPVRAPRVDRRSAAAAIRWAPVVGAAVGAAAGASVWGLRLVGMPPLVAGFLAVGLLALVTRGMHVDGLADTADGLGCFGPPERALAVMRDGGAGPFAVATLLVTVGVQAGSFASLPIGSAAPAVGALAGAVGRAGFAWCCRSGIPAARPGGLGATVAGSQPPWVALLWWAVLAAVATAASGGGKAATAVLAAAIVVIGLSAHTSRRFGGMSGDVLGAASELGTTTVLVVMASGALAAASN